MTKDESKAMRQQVMELLQMRGAHVDFDKVAADFPAKLRGTKPPGAEHAAWQLLEHLRIAQWDILEFSRNPKHVSPKWPEGYWPKNPTPPTPAAWAKSITQFCTDLRAMQELVADPNTDLLAPFPHGDGQTLLREALLLADHNSYHLGQLVLVRRLLGVWK
ncbi:MAG TPA: DinB family protein [Bryobacteraceae bacterium]|nr:DinB family protein [Bryobacteraceae bacterium]